MLLRAIHALDKFFLAHIRFKKMISKGCKRIVIGSSGQYTKGWAPSEKTFLNLLNPRDWEKFFSDRDLEAILAEHVWEHLTEEQAEYAAGICFTYLKPGGYLRVAVPDGLHPDPSYIENVRPGGVGAGSRDHKVLYTYATLKSVFESVGFQTRLYENYDINGQFNSCEWNPSDGMIRRSVRFDHRNREEKRIYTSIILDAIKPLVNTQKKRS